MNAAKKETAVKSISTLAIALSCNPDGPATFTIEIHGRDWKVTQIKDGETNER